MKEIPQQAATNIAAKAVFVRVTPTTPIVVLATEAKELPKSIGGLFSFVAEVWLGSTYPAEVPVTNTFSKSVTSTVRSNSGTGTSVVQ